MAKSLSETIQLIDSFISESKPSNQVVAARRWIAESIRAHLLEHGFPSTRRDKLTLSMIPFFFQEANYDGIEWGTQRANLGHLSFPLMLDALVQSGGKERAEMMPDEFSTYLELGRLAIKARSQAPPNFEI